MKKIVCIVLIFAAALTLTACKSNRERFFDTKWNFEHAIVRLGNGELIEGTVESWRDYSNSDVVQVTIGGITYLTHYSNVILCSSKP